MANGAMCQHVDHCGKSEYGKSKSKPREKPARCAKERRPKGESDTKLVILQLELA
jgi:hypothetical protein